MNPTVDAFHKLFYYDGPDGVPVWATTTWLGVKCEKNPLDAWVCQEIFFETKPELIIETGVRFGGSILYWASLCVATGVGRVVGIDITMKDVHPTVPKHPRVKLITGASTSPSVVGMVRKLAKGKRTMVVLDSDHTREHVLAELKAYGPLVTPGCYLVCEDGNVNGHPVRPDYGPGPGEALESFLSESSGWEVDRSREKLLMTFNPGGYLKRVV